MRVGIDVRPALSRPTGVGRYLRGLVPALVAEDVAVTAFSASLRERLDRSRFPGARVVDRRLPTRLLSAAWARLGWPRFETLAGPVNLTHSPTPLPLPSRPGCARVVTVHDLFFLDDPSAGAGEPQRFWVDALARSLAAADATIAVSAATATAIRARFAGAGERLHVVHHGLEPFWGEPPDAAAVAAARARHGRFVLAVGGLEKRKNYPALIAALVRVRRREPDLGLVIAGGDGPGGEAVRDAIAGAGLGSAVEIPGYQRDPELRVLYHAAIALAMPSLDEGFGFPVLEAMAAGCPVLAAAAGALPEVCANAALLVAPEDPAAIAAGLEKLVADTALAAELSDRGRRRAGAFSWAAAAKATREAYVQALARRLR